MRTRGAQLVAALAVAALLAGCGLGAGKGTSAVRLLVTDDFGRHTMGAVLEQQVPGSETVVRLLERRFRVTTRYGGGFVQGIDGRLGGKEAGRPIDWFYYVNGIEAPKGGAATPVHAGDRIWWDRHDWGETYTIPAVVGAFPEPFVHGEGGKRAPVKLECADGAQSACDKVASRLQSAGVIASRAVVGTGTGKSTLRVLVGAWPALRGEAALAAIERGPGASGVYARVDPSGRTIRLLDRRGRTARGLGPDSGLVAATRFEDQLPTWVVTGTDGAGLDAAAAAVDEPSLRGRFAVAIDAGRKVPVP